MNGTTLILNASEGRIQLVLAQERTILCCQDWSAPSKGTELLTPVLADTLQRLGMVPTDIERIACVAGPGSFTGLRLVLTTAAAFRRATGIPVAALNALQALAASLPAPLLGTPCRVRVLTHARRDLVHGQDFTVAAPGALPVPVGEPAMWDLETACDFSLGVPHILMGSGVARNLPVLREACSRSGATPILLTDHDHPAPHALLNLTLALAATAWVQQDLEPLYLRPCDAVDNLASIAAKRGQAPEEAYAELHRLLKPSL
ncbi:MAG: tRNA (adenosine(37)-N6)-threonylcarbamoyltransferase complex dimerization subunit type 1 TsaB [Bilophila sp.]